ncbi:glycoside hydrolase family 95 protein [Cristinia sonorae]|uniref:Glycoside hydrolase family 95 protein n=1 Tax=Cristinia sonorae TaxID=1940300 RepID=A0A8K0ULQ7_9AGAR|nr:glycoside hydrolase family 95 protein [Cristinia sonorae]
MYVKDETMRRRISASWLPSIAFFNLLHATTSFASPPGFPASGNGLWYRNPGKNWVTEWLPVGNGHLAAMTPGGTSKEVTQLNVESLWSGGPSQDPTYNGGNHDPSQREELAQEMRGIQQSIFDAANGTIANIDVLTVPAGAYGSYSTAGNLITTMNITANAEGYVRWLDMDKALARVSWSIDGDTYLRTTFCSNSAQACVQHNNSTSILPNITYAFDTASAGLPQPTVSCLDPSTLLLRGAVSEPGMAYELIGRVTPEGPDGQATCLPDGSRNATILVTGATASRIVWVGDTEFGIEAGDPAHGFSFRRELPHDDLLALLGAAAPQSFDSLLASHSRSHDSLLGGFSLSLGQTPDFSKPTDELKAAYKTDVGNPYLEWLLFNYGRYLLASSAPGVLPANLQGVWARDTGNPWSADYHANINLQMNYWVADSTNMKLVKPLFDYIEKTWVPRGSETARTLYNISRGWVTHNEMNIFGHTGMKGPDSSAQWANYPESAAWMAIHVWDHFDYTNDVEWWKTQGYPLIKGQAQFQLDKLLLDDHFNDSSLVVAPCNSPEQLPVTFACSHAQQLIWQLFNAVEKGFAASGDSDVVFLEEIRTKRAQMDKGFHIGSWGQLQEWKVDMDSPSDTHRHLSHLIGLFPGYAIANYDPSIQHPPSASNHTDSTTYTKEQIWDAARVSLIHRGVGTGPDADSGWEKVWRAAAWAQFANATGFYHELTYAVERDFAGNLFSVYDPNASDADKIFQIDANLGYPAALLNGLLQAPDVASLSTPLVVNILPALPQAWSSGSIKGARIRGAMTVDLRWAEGKPVSATLKVDNGAQGRPVRVIHNDREVLSFTSEGGHTHQIRF